MLLVRVQSGVPLCVCSSAGRALVYETKGRRFKSFQAFHTYAPTGGTGTEVSTLSWSVQLTLGVPHKNIGTIMHDADIAEVYVNKINTVYKYVHVDGAETTLKIKSNCSNADNNKLVLFVSSSVGCKARCSFCYLTTKNYKYKAIATNTIIKYCLNVLRSMPVELRTRYLKISFMGMGDTFIENIDIFDIVHTGVDVSTMFPNRNNEKVLNNLHTLNRDIYSYAIPLNPAHAYSKITTYDVSRRTVVRLFISLHSTKDSVRRALMPGTASIATIISAVISCSLDVIFHYMLLADINDTDDDIATITELFVHDKSIELRLLQYNKCPNATMDSSDKLDDFISACSAAHMKIKFQVSPGDEMLAACGQFICRSFQNDRD